MQDKFCEMHLPNGKIVKLSYKKFLALAGGVACAFAVAVGSAGYFYYQLADYRQEAPEYAQYKVHKAEQQTKLQQLLNDNEKMLRDMAEISNLEKKLRRAIIRDVDSNKLGTSTTNAALDAESTNSNYTGKGSGKPMDATATMNVLQSQNVNIMHMLDTTKKSVSQLLGEVEGRSGTLASFPDRWPTEGGVISSEYGGRTDPVSGGYEYHCGLDIAIDFGAPIYATAAGTIEQAGWNGGYGRFVRINHGNGYETAYGHMSGLAVSAGQHVAKGDIIGFAGSSGYSTGPHVHYEVMADGQYVDPHYVLK